MAVLFALAPVVLSARQATNRDQSGYTDLHDPGFPIAEVQKVVDAAAAPLKPNDMVLGIVLGGAARAYPVSFLWGPEHEVLNDTLGGSPIAPTWCPLAHSGVVYDRRQGGRVLELGNRGAHHGTLVLYDRESGSSWSQVGGDPIAGDEPSRRLDSLPSTVTTWQNWRTLHPDTTVYIAPSVPFRSRFTGESFALMAFGGPGPIRNEDWVVGIAGATSARAWPVRRLAVPRLANDETEDGPIVVFLARDDATVSIFNRRVGGRTLTFTAEGEGMRDTETGSVWDPPTGRASAGPLRGQALSPIPFTSALWYAWKAYRPHATLWGEEARSRSY